METSANYLIKITADLINTVATEPELPIFNWPAQNLPLNVVLEGEHFAHTDIETFNSVKTTGGTDYGQVNNSTYYYHSGIDPFSPQGGSSGQVITINSITWDLTARTGTFDCSFSFTDDNNTAITGVYVGNYDILVGY